MAKHNNQTIAQNTLRQLNTKQGDNIGSQVGEIIVPTIEIKSTSSIVRNVTLNATGAGTLYTTPTDRDFYIDAIQMSFAKDANCNQDTATYTLTTTIAGVSRVIFSLGTIAFTAHALASAVEFTRGIKVDRGVTIVYNGTYTAGNSIRTATIYGHTEDVISAPQI